MSANHESQYTRTRAKITKAEAHRRALAILDDDIAYFVQHPDQRYRRRACTPEEDCSGSAGACQEVLVERVTDRYFRYTPLDSDSLGWSVWDRRRRKRNAR